MLANGEPPTQRTAGAFLDALKSSGHAHRCLAAFNEMAAAGVDVGNVCFNIVVSALVQVRPVFTALRDAMNMRLKITSFVVSRSRWTRRFCCAFSLMASSVHKRRKFKGKCRG